MESGGFASEVAALAPVVTSAAAELQFAVAMGLGRTVALCCRPSTSYQIR